MRENRRHLARMAAVCGMATIGATGIVAVINPVILGGSLPNQVHHPTVAASHRLPTNLAHTDLAATGR
jgi:hypothetical protein